MTDWDDLGRGIEGTGVGEIPAFDVSGALAVLNQTLEYALPVMTVVGELDSFKISKGKWVYADIKDDYAKLRLFGTVYVLPGPLEDGMTVEVIARPQIHPQYGFSLSVQSIRPVGEGSLKKAANLLAQKLEAEGLFDAARKRLVPHPPLKVGLVTAADSAAYADFIKIMNARWGGVEVSVFDAQVQGEPAVASIVEGITYFNQESELCDVVVIIRGGGSIDDLAAFSTEQVVRAVTGSRIPTLVAIGHEIDESLAELAADMRASTPSNAAELLFPDRNQELEHLRLLTARLNDLVVGTIKLKFANLNDRSERLGRMVELVIDAKLQTLTQFTAVLEAIHPQNALKRGFVLAEDEKGKLIVSSKAITGGQHMKLIFKDGAISATAGERV